MRGWTCTLSFLIFVLAFSNASPLAWGQDQVVLLWADGAPGSLGDREEDKPSLTVFRSASTEATGSAVVICPGGGYWNLAMDHEGYDVARWFNQQGVHAFVLKYRLSQFGYRHPAMLQDARRAIRTVRARADEWGVDRERLGIMGFSAGGHLASTAATHFDSGNPEAGDLIERMSSRPTFLVLAYPVVSFETSFTHRGSRENLLGKDPDLELVQLLSNETQVDTMTPPTFLVHTSEDTGVPPENSVLFFLALRKAGVPAELHIYQKGRHGLGMAPDDPIFSSWTERLRDWLRVQGLLGRPGTDSRSVR